jgi:hypothetical protein
MTRRPDGAAHDGQIAGKIMPTEYAEVAHERISVNVLRADELRDWYSIPLGRQIVGRSRIRASALGS